VRLVCIRRAISTLLIFAFFIACDERNAKFVPLPVVIADLRDARLTIEKKFNPHVPGPVGWASSLPFQSAFRSAAL
jgi:hypothetical protein